MATPRRLSLVLLLSGLALLLLVAEPVRGQPPPVDPGSPVVWVQSMNISPSAPPVGTNYTVTVAVASRHHRSLEVRAWITPPTGDSVVYSPPTQVIGPYGSTTFTFTAYCGVDGGTVHGHVEPVREIF